MIEKLISIRISAVLATLLVGTSVVNAHAQPMSTATHPNNTQGFSFGLGAGVKLVNLKNIITQTTLGGVQGRSHDDFANTSSPTIGVYVRKYCPDLAFLPLFFGFDFEYLTQLRKQNMFTPVNLGTGTQGVGYKYTERWDARAMIGAQVLTFSQVDFWAQLGLQVTNFEYQGLVNELAGGTQRFIMDNNYALAPAGGLEARFSQPNQISNGVVTDYILGWTACYRKAISVMGTTTPPASNTFNFAQNANWSHTFAIKVMFRY
jgi:hypothetical protein